MKKRRTQNNRSVYAVLGALNVCLIVTFSFVLSPKPHVVVAAIGPSEHLVQPQVPLAEMRLAKQGVPTRVEVKSIALDLQVKPGSYEPENQTWTLDDTSAFYADRTVPANTRNGTTLLYGHGTWPVFGRIGDIREGDEARVTTDTGLTFTYVFQSSRQVTPTDTSVLTSQGPPTLVLQTCSGPFDKYRTLVAFRLVKVAGYE